MLQRNESELSPFFTASGVHHLVFHLRRPGPIVVDDFKTCWDRYTTGFRELPFRLESLPDTSGAP